MGRFEILGVIALATVCGSPTAHAHELPGVTEARAAIRTKDFAAAVTALSPAAESGDSEARYLLASLYRSGLGVVPDVQKARALLTKAAEAAHAPAAYALAASFASEEPLDPVAAQRWLEHAATLEHAIAKQVAARDASPRGFVPQRDIKDPKSRRAALWRAVQENDARTTAALLDVNSSSDTDSFGRNLIAAAAENGACQSVRVLIERRVDPDRPDAFGSTPLMLAAGRGALECVQGLLAAHANVDAKDRGGNTALMHAAKLRPANASLVAEVLDASRDPAARNVEGWSALDWALTVGDAAVVALLRERGIESRSAAGEISTSPQVPFRRASRGDLYRGWSDVQLATARGTSRLFDALQAEQSTASSGDVSLRPAIAANSGTLAGLLRAQRASRRGDDRADAVVWALRHATPETVRVLLENGAIGDAARAGVAPLGVAVRARRADIVSLLLEAGVEVRETDDAGRTLLMLAAAVREPTIVKALLAHVAPVDAQDREGRTALSYAAAASDVESAAALLASGCPVSVADRSGQTPLAVAAARGDARLVALLLKAGAGRAPVQTGSVTPLMLAARSGDIETIEMLAQVPMAIDAQNRHGDTALLIAARYGRVDVVKALLQVGASRSIRNADRMTALDVAQALSHTDIEQLLSRD